MDLRELKKEVHSLPNFSEQLQKFRDSWVKPIKSNTNKHLPFLQNLSPEKKQEINTKLFAFQQKIKEVEHAQVVHQKLQEYAKYLIELKLTTLNGNTRKAEYITKHLLQDEFLNTKFLLHDIKYLEKNVKSLAYKYHHINELLHHEAPLEESVHFMHLPHQEHLQILLSTSRKQKTLVKDLGEHFVALAKQTRRKA
ncbi:MAG TPA: hypothetical protein VJB13_02180 [Candidatus Nanoarchaeia archaeon]|nr:hypothetical protein [Candidatus Nanoarchaeia archaeon]